MKLDIIMLNYQVRSDCSKLSSKPQQSCLNSGNHNDSEGEGALHLIRAMLRRSENTLPPPGTAFQPHTSSHTHRAPVSPATPLGSPGSFKRRDQRYSQQASSDWPAPCAFINVKQELSTAKNLIWNAESKGHRPHSHPK